MAPPPADGCYFGARSAMIFSKRGSPCNESEYFYDWESTASPMIFQTFCRCSSVVSRFPNPRRITMRPRNFVWVKYALPDALIFATVSLFF